MRQMSKLMKTFKIALKLPINYNTSSRRERKIAREQCVDEQKGSCWFCDTLLSGQPADFVVEAVIDWDLFPEGFTMYPVHLHHDHNSGMSIGAVHALCNA